MFIAVRHIKAIEPSFLRRTRIVEEKKIRRNRSIRREDASRKTDYRMEVELREQLLLDVHLGVVRAEEKPVGQNNRRASTFFKAVHDDRHKKIRRLGTRQIRGEVTLYIRLLAAAVGRIHKNHIES